MNLKEVQKLKITYANVPQNGGLLSTVIDVTSYNVDSSGILLEFLNEEKLVFAANLGNIISIQSV